MTPRGPARTRRPRSSRLSALSSKSHLRRADDCGSTTAALTKYDPLSGVRSLNFCICALTARYPSALSASFSLKSNLTLIEKCHTASRHAGVTAVAPAAPGSGSYRKGVAAMRFGVEKGSTSVMSARSSARVDVLVKMRLGMRRVPVACSMPTACSSYRTRDTEYVYAVSYVL